MMIEVLNGLRHNPDNNTAIEQRVRAEAWAMCARFPIH